jgi:hypothetical protein
VDSKLGFSGLRPWTCRFLLSLHALFMVHAASPSGAQEVAEAGGRDREAREAGGAA